MTQNEKPPIRGGHPPEVSDQGSTTDSLRNHRDDMFFAAIETTRMPMLVTDPRQDDNPIVFANRAFLSMTGYEPEEIMGQNCRFLQGPQTDRSAVAAIRQAIEAGREITIEILNYRKDGTSFWNALYVSPVFNQRKEIVFFFASQLDVSRRREAEDALAQAQRMEALGQLTGGISHDFNNLLQVMSGHVEILAAKSRKGLLNEEAAARGFDHIRSAIAKASTLTQQLLAFSRKQRLEGRTVNLNTIVANLADMLDRTFGDGVTVRLSLAKELDNCHLDVSQLELALLNVLVNARDAMPDGGTVTVKTKNQLIGPEDAESFSGLAPGRYVAISVTDTGVGIPAEIIARVMEPFFTTKDEGKGTGLGLSMVHGFAKQSGGAAAIYSELGVGTTVRLYFPVSKDAARPESATAVRVVDQGGDETILVVDDRPEVAELSREMLMGLGYTVRVAHGGREALALIGNLPPDQQPRLLFSDVIMPGGMNGFVLARNMRDLVPGLRVLLTTGYAAPDEEPAPEEEFPVLKKPYRLADLARRVRAVLDA